MPAAMLVPGKEDARDLILMPLEGEPRAGVGGRCHSIWYHALPPRNWLAKSQVREASM